MDEKRQVSQVAKTMNEVRLEKVVDSLRTTITENERDLKDCSDRVIELRHERDALRAQLSELNKHNVKFHEDILFSVPSKYVRLESDDDLQAAEKRGWNAACDLMLHLMRLTIDKRSNSMAYQGEDNGLTDHD